MADDKKKKKNKDKSDKAEKKVEKNKKRNGVMLLEGMPEKYRPRAMKDLVGQNAVVTQLRGMFKGESMPQTFLIAGNSGCGKTTTAWIIARTLLCTNLTKDFTPCGECTSCRYEDLHPDVLEMNMAKERGIDEARAMIASSNNMPTLGRYRIFILDEVHAWTPQAESAFLKPLEKPPAKTVWILCTTDPQKLKATILGRAKKLPVRPIEPKDMAARLLYVAQQEGVDLAKRDDHEKILRLICDMSNGQMRDAIELLSGVIYAIRSGDKLDTKEIIQTVVQAGEADLDKASAYLIASVLNGDLKDVITQTRSAGSTTRGLLSKCRWLIQYLLDNVAGVAKYTPYNAKIFTKVAKDNGIKVNLRLLIKLQMLLVEVEARMNSMSIDETVLFMSALGNFMATEITTKEK